MKSKYFVAYLLENDAKAYHERLMRELAARYRVFPLSRKAPPHITLKAPFEADAEEIGEVERVLRAFAHGERAVPLTLSGFGRFGFRTIYVDVVESPEAVALTRRVLDVLRQNIRWMRTQPLEGNKLHASVVRFLTRRQSRRVRRYLATLPVPRFRMLLDHIAILKKDGPLWRLHALIALTTAEEKPAPRFRERAVASRKRILVS